MIKINASHQRRERFHACQQRKRPLNLVQDVKTRWNSTLRMMKRARKLREALSRYATECPNDKIYTFSEEEWRHVDYLIDILHPFKIFTEAIGRVESGPTVHMVFEVYNQLFSHMEDNIRLLKRKRLPWKIKIRQALDNGYHKLSHYYTKTKDHIGKIYAIATILAPQYKLATFETEDWKDGKNYPWVSHLLIVTSIIAMLILSERHLSQSYLSSIPGVSI